MTEPTTQDVREAFSIEFRARLASYARTYDSCPVPEGICTRCLKASAVERSGLCTCCTDRRADDRDDARYDEAA